MTVAIALSLGAIAVANGCSDPVAPSPSYGMPERDGAADLSGVTLDFRTWGGAAAIYLTGEPSDSALADLQALGVAPINFPASPHSHWVYGGIPGEDVTALVADRPYVTAIDPLHDPPYGPVDGPSPVAADSALHPGLEVRASLNLGSVAPGETVDLTVSLTNPADTVAVITYGHSCFFVLRPDRLLADGTEVALALDGATYGCQDVVWSDTVEAGTTQTWVRQITASIEGVPVPAGTYQLEVWRNATPTLPELDVSFEVVGGQ
jgi:hypothetical protein